MDRQKDGYIRKEDLVTGLRSSTSFSLSMYREEFILAGLMVAGFLLYQVQVSTWIRILWCFPKRWQSSTDLCRLSACTTGPSGHEPSFKSPRVAHFCFRIFYAGISDSLGAFTGIISATFLQWFFQEFLVNQWRMFGKKRKRNIYLTERSIRMKSW